MSHRHSPLRTTLVALAAAPLALGLAACGSDDDADDDATPTSSATSSAPSSAPASTPASADSAGDQAGSGGASDAALLAAGETALGAVDGTVFSISGDAGSWEVQVVTADGAENELQVSSDGSSVERGPVVDQDDADDLAERRQLLADAELDVAAAIDAARGSVPDGTVTGVDLDLDRGTATWDVQFDEDTADEQTVTVDAVTGEVLRTERDD